MQAVLSRVHRIVVAPGPADAASASASPPSLPAVQQSEIPQEPPSQQRPTHGLADDAKAEIALAVERLQYATLLSERKKAVAVLLALAEHFRPLSSPSGNRSAAPTTGELALGSAAVPAVLTALVSDPRDTELMEAMLEILQALVARSPPTALLLLEQPLPQPGQMTSTWGLQTCLTLLQDSSPWIRGPSISLVRALQDAQPSAFAHTVLECKEGLRRLLEVVEDRHEHIRDAALAVLGQLTGRDKNAQQFLAFEDGFAQLFQIMELEGLGESSSSVSSDCLQIVNNMVRDNLMTQTLLLDMPYLESHVPLLLRLPDVHDEEEDTAAMGRRKRVLKLGLQLVRFLVAGLYEGRKDTALDEMARRDRARKAQDLSRIQSLVARQQALMGAIGELACCQNDTLADLRLQALDLLRLVSERNGGVQMILVNLYAWPSGRNVLAELVSLDVSKESDESPVAAAASALLDELFQENEGARMALLQHIHAPPPPPISARVDDVDSNSQHLSTPPSAGRVLLDAFISNVEVVVECSDRDEAEALNGKLMVAWKASHRLASLLADSAYCKELALRVPAQYEDSEARAVPGGLFLSRCLRLLRSLSDEETSTAAFRSMTFQVKLAVLSLLIRWCHCCPKAVQEIVGSVSNLSVLVDSLSEPQTSTSPRDLAETTQLRGLVALLLGCCLEFLTDDEDQQALEMAKTVAVATEAAAQEQEDPMTREQLLEMISRRVGLERFTDALVQFQQSPAVLACAQASKTRSSRTLLAYRAAYDVDDEDEASADGEGTEAHYLFMLYERAFTTLYRELAERIQKRIIAIYTRGDRRPSSQTGVDPGAMAAYQDLIRVQDKQIHELQKQVEKLKLTQGEKRPGSDAAASTKTTGLDQQLEERLAAQCEQFEGEKRGLENRIKVMTEAATEMETRVNGLSMAYEQLEHEHQQHGQELAIVGGTEEGATLLSNAEAQLVALRAELEAERQANRRLQSEASVTKGDSASHALREKSEAELANARLEKQLEEMRVDSDRKDEQLAECHQMLETLTEGQALVNSDNEKLRAQLTQASMNEEAYANAGEDQSVVESLSEGKARLERRVAELEAAARAAFEKDQEVLQQRILEVEQARRASPPVSEDCSAREVAIPNAEKLEEARDDDHRLKNLVTSQLAEIQELRALVLEMETLAREHEAQAQQVAFLQELVAGYNVQTRRDKDKFDATVRELEDELARAFLEKKEAGRKTKAEVKELENEVARLFLAKVELEKELAGQQHLEEGEAPLPAANGSSRRSSTDDDSTEDLLVLVASLEIQCSVLRESLLQAQGEHAERQHDEKAIGGGHELGIEAGQHGDLVVNHVDMGSTACVRVACGSTGATRTQLIVRRVGRDGSQ
ncbi:hypothetical protein BBJ28_00022103 [Nothophytophthora sp. Chile5]|nr:hypothetical protein BBJ28_00022103 [Nothophytophthora sp. Chile5]